MSRIDWLQWTPACVLVKLDVICFYYTTGSGSGWRFGDSNFNSKYEAAHNKGYKHALHCIAFHATVLLLLNHRCGFQRFLLGFPSSALYFLFSSLLRRRSDSFQPLFYFCLSVCPVDVPV